MPIEVNEFFTNIYDYFYDSTGLNRIFSSILYTSAFLTVVIILLIMLLYPCKSGTPGWKIFRVAIYMFLAVCGTFAIHRDIVRRDYKHRLENDSTTALVSNVQTNSPVFDADKITVKPNIESNVIGGDIEESETVFESTDDILNKLESKYN